MIQRVTAPDDRAAPAGRYGIALVSDPLALLPHPSPGLLASPLGELTVVYDLVTEVVHLLNASAAVVWASCDGHTDAAAAVDAIVAGTGADRAQVTADLEASVAELRTAGLVGREGPTPEPPEIERPAVTGTERGAVHAVLDEGVRFVGDDASLVAEIDALVGLGTAGGATVELGVTVVDDGTVQLVGWGPARTYGSRAAFLDALPSALNVIAAASTSCIALHSGAVRSPAGEVVLLPALSGSGKTTLTAALVRDGWAYATDEAVGVREGSLVAVAYPKPLVLGLESQALLGLPPTGTLNVAPSTLRADVEVLRGEIGRVGRVVLPRFEAGAAVEVVPLDPPDAVVGILEHALNLARVGEAGLDALCELALQVPVHRLVHGGVADAIPAIEALLEG